MHIFNFEYFKILRKKRKQKKIETRTRPTRSAYRVRPSSLAYRLHAWPSTNKEAHCGLAKSNEAGPRSSCTRAAALFLSPSCSDRLQFYDDDACFIPHPVPSVSEQSVNKQLRG
jgi:hypothetical protein